MSYTRNDQGIRRLQPPVLPLRTFSNFAGAGCGGQAFLDAGLGEPKWALEWDRDAGATIKYVSTLPS